MQLFTILIVILLTINSNGCTNVPSQFESASIPTRLQEPPLGTAAPKPTPKPTPTPTPTPTPPDFNGDLGKASGSASELFGADLEPLHLPDFDPSHRLLAPPELAKILLKREDSHDNSLRDHKNSILESYSVTVAANEQLTIPGPPGELRVWIGISSKAPRTQSGMVTETKELEAVGETAKIKPFALGIDVDQKESICSKIDPTGTEVRFKLIPKEEGEFTVGADVELYNSNNCSGTPVPKSAKSVTVNVSVDNNKIIEKSSSELISIAWKTLLDFWEKLLLLAFALLLFLIRKKLSKLFGFQEKE